MFHNYMRERPQTESHDVLKTDAKYLQTIGKQHYAIKHKLLQVLFPSSATETL